MSQEIGNFVSDFKAKLYGNERKDLAVSFAMSKYLSHKDQNKFRSELIFILYDLSRNLELNALRIGYCMSLLDSRCINSDLRKRLGLYPDFNPINKFSKPIVDSPLGNNYPFYAEHCSSSEVHLMLRHGEVEVGEIQDRINKFRSIERPVILYDSLLVEVDGIYTGFANNTVEFVNGTVLIKDCFYLLSDSKTRSDLDAVLCGKKKQNNVYRLDEDGFLLANPVKTRLKISRTLHDGYNNTIDNIY